MNGENLEREQKAEYDAVAELKDLLHNHSDAVPEKILTNEQKDAFPNMKVRKNWWESVFLAFGDLVEEGKLPDELKTAARKFMAKYRGKLENDIEKEKDIEEAEKAIKEANELIEKVLKFLESK